VVMSSAVAMIMGVWVLVVVVLIVMIMVVTTIIDERHAYVVLVSAPAGQAHDSATISTEVTSSSRPVTIWTSALPQGHSSSS